jgi:hypothetical protein
MTKEKKLELLDTRPDRPFDQWRHNVHSQCGEDGIIAHLLEVMRLSTGYFVEFGAWDGRHLSNCANLADRGWAGCFIEGEVGKHADLLKNYADRTDIAKVLAYVVARGGNSLDDILRRCAAPKSPTIVSIDIDGNDYHVWSSLIEYQPVICVIEFNPTVPAHVVFVQRNEFSMHQGCSLAALWQLGRSKGYSLVAATEFNGIFVRDDACREHGLTTYLPDEVKDRTYETAIFHGFDGTMLTAGHRALLWHGIAFADGDVQVLPSDLRKFPIGQPANYYERLQEFITRRKAQPF